MTKIFSNKVRLLAVLVMAFFVFGVWVLHIDTFIVVLNGLFIGTSVTIIIAYWRLFWDALTDTNPYNRARQMTWSFFLAYIAILCGALGSIYTRTYDLPTQSTILLALGRYTAIVAAIMQVTAPDFGRGIFYGKDRKMLAGAVACGLVVTGLLIYLQGTAAASILSF